MIRRFGRWFRRRLRPGQGPGPYVGRETRRLLDSGERHLAAAETRGGREPCCQEEYRRAESSFRTAAHRHPVLPEAMEGRASSLYHLALSRMDAGDKAPAEWTRAVVQLGRLLSFDPARATARLARAGLYLAAAIDLRSEQKAARASIEEARKDIQWVLEQSPRDDVALALREVMRRITDHEAGREIPLPRIEEIRRLVHFFRGTPLN